MVDEWRKLLPIDRKRIPNSPAAAGKVSSESHRATKAVITRLAVDMKIHIHIHIHNPQIFYGYPWIWAFFGLKHFLTFLVLAWG